MTLEESFRTTLRAGNTDEAVAGLARICLSEPFELAYALCVEFAQSGEPGLRGIAILGFGHLARRFRRLDRAVVEPLLSSALRDANSFVSGHARSASEDVHQFLGWRVPGLVAIEKTERDALANSYRQFLELAAPLSELATITYGLASPADAGIWLAAHHVVRILTLYVEGKIAGDAVAEWADLVASRGLLDEAMPGVRSIVQVLAESGQNLSIERAQDLLHDASALASSDETV